MSSTVSRILGDCVLFSLPQYYLKLSLLEFVVRRESVGFGVEGVRVRDVVLLVCARLIPWTRPCGNFGERWDSLC
jgi:hypothetical protein